MSLINEFKNNIEEKINKTLNSSDTVSIKTNISDTKLITISLLKNEIKILSLFMITAIISSGLVAQEFNIKSSNINLHVDIDKQVSFN